MLKLPFRLNSGVARDRVVKISLCYLGTVCQLQIPLKIALPTFLKNKAGITLENGAQKSQVWNVKQPGH